jgi:tetratricopeptide (TPR) repeat protein
VQRGVPRASTHPGALLNLARFRLNYEWDFDGYDRLMRRAIQLYPDYAELHLLYGQDLHMVGLPDSALAEHRQAAALDPTSAFAVANVAFSLTSMGRFDEAAPFYRRVVSLDSLLWWVPVDAATIASFQGRHEDAAREIERVHKILGDVPWVLPYVVGCSRHARPEVASAAIARLETLSRQQYVQPVFIAHARLYLGDRSAALDGLEASFNARDRDFLWKLAEGEFEALRGDLRYETILRRTGLNRYMRPPSKFEARGPSLYGCR